jgi:TonB family protein
MEAFAAYLFRSVIWLTGFTLIFVLFLRNERFFFLKRIYLISGIIASLLLPLITIHYYIELPSAAGIEAGNAGLSETMVPSAGRKPDIGLILFALYTIGVLVMTLKVFFQSRSVLRSIKKSDVIVSTPVKLVRTTSFASSFSFFSYVFVNPSVSDVETREIMNHELVHIRQRHWADLILAELLCMLQWFNPMCWLYVHFIRQNHEYLADEGALQRTSDPSVYRATLLNQIAGSTIFSLSNPFSYSLTKRRFNMMKNMFISPYRKLKLLLILPVVAAILYAFAKPEYRLPSGSDDQPLLFQQKTVKGVVLQKSGAPLGSATVIVKGTTIGTVADSKGNFSIGNFPEEMPLIITYVGFTSKVVKPDFKSEMRIVLERDTINVGAVQMAPPPPPPPPPPFMSGNGKPPLLVIDGKISAMKIEDMDPNTIESINVLKDETAVDKYGDKGKDGVLEITTKKGNLKPVSEAVDKPVNVKEGLYVIVEELPKFPGGPESLRSWLSSNTKYPAEAVKQKITGKVFVIFEVTETGAVKNVSVEKGVHPLLDTEAVRVVSTMPAWKPGSQAGKPVSVFMRVSVVFDLK